MKGFRAGDKVEILRKDIFHLKHRKNRNGIITYINGSYIYVRPMWCRWEIELYECEIRKIS